MIPSVRTVPSTSIAFTAAKAFLTLRMARVVLLISSAMLFVGEVWAVHLYLRREAQSHIIIQERHAGAMSGYTLSLLVASQCHWT